MAPPSNSETGSASDEKTESELALARCRIDLMIAIARLAIYDYDDIDEGYDLSDLPEGWFPLLMATQLDSYTAVVDLLEEGADPEERVMGGVHGNIEPSVWHGYVERTLLLLRLRPRAAAATTTALTSSLTRLTSQVHGFLVGRAMRPPQRPPSVVRGRRRRRHAAPRSRGDR